MERKNKLKNPLSSLGWASGLARPGLELLLPRGHPLSWYLRSSYPCLGKVSKVIVIQVSEIWFLVFSWRHRFHFHSWHIQLLVHSVGLCLDSLALIFSGCFFWNYCLTPVDCLMFIVWNLESLWCKESNLHKMCLVILRESLVNI